MSRNRVAPYPNRVLNAKNLSFFLLGVVILIFLLRQIDLKELRDQILGVRWELFLAGAGVYFLKSCLRAVRLNRISADLSLPYFKTLRLSLATSLATQILPFKLGEFSYVYLLKQEKNAPAAQGLSALIVIRLMDLLAIGVLYLAVALALRSPQSGVQMMQALIFIGLLGAGMGLLMALSRLAPPVLEKVKAKSFPEENFLSRLVEWGEKFFRYFQAYRPQQFAQWMGLALLEWIANYGMFHLLLLGMSVPVTFFQTATAVTFAAVASALPVNVVGSFGSQEAGWTAALLLVQVSRQTAITTAFSTHILTLAYIAFFGALAWLSYLLRLGSRPE